MKIFLSGLIPIFAIYLYIVSFGPKFDAQDKDENRDQFYEIDKLIDDSELGASTMSYEDYEAFVENGLTLEGVIFKFGAPSHVTGSDKGDKYMEVAYPSDEYGYSIGLKFENKPGGIGDWILTDKYVVETDGIGFSEYETK